LSDADCERMFMPFLRTDSAIAPALAATGLGLAIARQLMRLHGGDVTAEALAGGGATLVLRTPLDAREPERPVVSEAAVATPWSETRSAVRGWLTRLAA
jgi:signal transduction histidine kinase